MENVANQVDDGKRVLQCRFRRNGVIVNSVLFGGAWEKVGFEVGPVRQIHTSVRTYDFAQSPAILVSFDNLVNVMRNKYGNYSFFIPNTTVFGSRIFYNSIVERTCQTLILPHSVFVNRLRIKLTNCDLKKLETVRGNAATTN